jgi:hypothetical protein
MGKCILVWWPNLEAQLIKLQNLLKIPDADRFIPDIKLQKPQTMEIRVVQVHPTKFDSQGRVIVEKENSTLYSYTFRSPRKSLLKRRNWKGYVHLT